MDSNTPPSSPPKQQSGFSSDRDEMSADSMDTSQGRNQANLGSPASEVNGKHKVSLNRNISPPKTSAAASAMIVKASMSSDDEEDNVPWAEKMKAGASKVVRMEHSKKTKVTEMVIKTEPGQRKSSSGDKKKKKKQESSEGEQSEAYSPEEDEDEDAPKKKKAKKIESASNGDLKVKIKHEKDYVPGAEDMKAGCSKKVFVYSNAKSGELIYVEAGNKGTPETIAGFQHVGSLNETMADVAKLDAKIKACEHALEELQNAGIHGYTTALIADIRKLKEEKSGINALQN